MSDPLDALYDLFEDAGVRVTLDGKVVTREQLRAEALRRGIRRIKTTGPKQPRIDPIAVARALGAEPLGHPRKCPRCKSAGQWSRYPTAECEGCRRHYDGRESAPPSPGEVTYIAVTMVVDGAERTVKVADSAAIVDLLYDDRQTVGSWLRELRDEAPE